MPFASEATLEIDMEEPSELDLVLYDVGGKEIVKLTEGYNPQGNSKIRIDGTNLSPGPYILKIHTQKTTEERVIVRK